MKIYLSSLSLCLISSFCFAAELTTNVYSTNDPDIKIGSIRFEDGEKGLMIYPNLSKLSPGIHGMHIHELPNCDQGGDAAGPHFDPKQTRTHQGPYQQGHLGDLPALSVNQEGIANLPLLAPHLTSKDLENHALIIHEQGDNYSDKPELGGGGKHIACGIIKG